MLALLLLFFGQAIDHASYAVRIGGLPTSAARSVLVGNGNLHLPGASTPLSKVLSVAYADGVRRAFKFCDLPQPTIDAIAPKVVDIYRSVAEKTINDMSDTLNRHINESLDASRDAGFDTAKTARQLRNDLNGGGYGYGTNTEGEKTTPWILESVTELNIVNTNGAGQWDAYQEPSAADRTVGFIHRSVVDEGTTEICLERDGFCRPADDEYWSVNWPSLHFGCRSGILPIFKVRKWSENYPVTSPAPGFGRRPMAFGAVWAK